VLPRPICTAYQFVLIAVVEPSGRRELLTRANAMSK
jgi:hypothetical protein